MISDLKLFQAGYCTHREFVTIKGGSLKKASFPAVFAYIKHSIHGNILFDTGYSTEFYHATKPFPFNIYAGVTPVFIHEQNSAAALLNEYGIKTDDINYIILSHFHADHISGLKQFPRAKFIYNREAYCEVSGLSAFGELKRGFLKALLPKDFELRSEPFDFSQAIDVRDRIAPFSEGVDLFGDGSMILVELQGHAKGQVGLLVRESDGRETFLIADAAWRSKSYKELLFPNRMAYFIMNNAQAYNQTLEKLNALYLSKKDIRIIPSHCNEFFKEL